MSRDPWSTPKKKREQFPCNAILQIASFGPRHRKTVLQMKVSQETVRAKLMVISDASSCALPLSPIVMTQVSTTMWISVARDIRHTSSATPTLVMCTTPTCVTCLHLHSCMLCQFVGFVQFRLGVMMELFDLFDTARSKCCASHHCC